MATSPAGSSTTSRLFYITYHTIGTCFLVDTGADVSVIPSSAAEKRKPASMILQAVKKSAISICGEKSMTLDIRLRCSFRWIFIIADLPFPILGADFLAHFGLRVDVQHRTLIDTTTGLSLNGIQSTAISPRPVFHFPASTPYKDLLCKFPNISSPCYNESSVKHSVTHQIRTTGPSVFCHPRRLAPDCPKIAKSEFDHML